MDLEIGWIILQDRVGLPSLAPWIRYYAVTHFVLSINSSLPWSTWVVVGGDNVVGSGTVKKEKIDSVLRI